MFSLMYGYKGMVLLMVLFVLLILSGLFLMQSQTFILNKRIIENNQQKNLVNQVRFLIKDALQIYYKEKVGLSNLLILKKDLLLDLCLNQLFVLQKKKNCEEIKMSDTQFIKASITISKEKFSFAEFEKIGMTQFDFRVAMSLFFADNFLGDSTYYVQWDFLVLIPNEEFKFFVENNVISEKMLEETNIIWLQSFNHLI